jgi:hypothetical protein
MGQTPRIQSANLNKRGWAKPKNPAAGVFETDLHHNQGSLVEYAVAKQVCANSLH